MNLDDLAIQPCPWLRGSGDASDVVLSTRVRLARNFSDYPFVGRGCERDLRDIVKTVEKKLPDVFGDVDVAFLDFNEVPDDVALLLQERNHVSREFCRATHPRALILQENEEFSVMVNEEDHLRIQSIISGLALKEAWRRVDKIDDLFDSVFQYAFDEKLGYLTASPSNLGTGLRASVVLHIPGLVETGETPKVLRSLQKLNLTARGIYGKDMRPLGEFYHISNLSTLGPPELLIVDQFREVVDCVVAYEREARETVLRENRSGALDRACRALALLGSARSMPFDEALTHLSSVRLGVRTGLLDGVSNSTIDNMLLQIQRAHLRRIAEAKGVVSDDDDEDALRAAYIRKKLIEKETDAQ